MSEVIASNIEYLNEFERKTLITQLSDFEIKFTDTQIGDTISTRIEARRKDKDKVFYFNPFTLSSQGLPYKKEMASICNSIIQNDKWDDLQKSEVKKI